MIHMPHRNVTRFFIPLIDVLLLLFCVFLLMPIANQDELQNQMKYASDKGLEVEILEEDMQRLTMENKSFEELRPQLLELKKIKEELRALKESSRRDLQQRAYFQIIDINGKDGTLSYFDPSLPKAKARLAIDSKKAADELIGRHQKEAGEKRDIYYFFLYPRPAGAFPTLGQERTYKQWFATVANSLREIDP